MTQEEKQLLLKDLCARLPYGVKVAIDYKTYLNWLPDDTEDDHYKEHFNFLLKHEKKTIEEKSLEPQIICSYPSGERFGTFRGCHDDYGIPVELIKPYLRPMSSMTKEEENIYNNSFNRPTGHRKVWVNRIDYLISHHFDYRGLIPMGLALPAGEGIYKMEE